MDRSDSAPLPWVAAEEEIPTAQLEETEKLDNVQQGWSQKKNIRRMEKKEKERCNSPGSVGNLLTELPFITADTGALFERTPDKKKKKNRKRTVLFKNENDTEKKQKKANYFVSLPITNPKILADIQTFEDAVLQKDKRLSEAMNRNGSFHITLLLMHLASEEEISVAVSALLESKGPIEEILQGKALVLPFRGVADFKHEVVFGKMTNGDLAIATLQEISETMEKIFKEKGIFIIGNRAFLPHLTFMKLSRAPKLRYQGLRKIDPYLYEDFQDHYFGDETLNCLDLCSMAKERQQNGYYYTEASICFGQKNGREPDDAELVSLSKKLVENAVLKAVQQYLEETQAKTRQTDGNPVETAYNEKNGNNTGTKK
ncbi:A-kinase anchoring protein 7 isoform X2 [Ascaphus truei]|uniref:A-kinase anchoring protein 7 isoform X2 n=1 Tax=Ascaphus truei TaxID=8439 RepID=UPI003F5903CC